MKFISVFFLTVTVIFAKNPAFILYDDGTWEKAGGGSYDLSSSSSSNSSMGSLEVRAMLTMRSGDSKPVGNADVYLTTKSIAEIGRLMGRNPTYNFISDWKLSIIGLSLTEYQGVAKGYVSGLNDSLIDSDITDLDGKVVLSGISPGKYYVNLHTALGGTGGCAWSVPVIIKPGRNKVILRNDNVNEDLFHEGESQITSPSPVSSASSAPAPSTSFKTPPPPPPLPDLEALLNAELDNPDNADFKNYLHYIKEIQSNYKSKKISKEKGIEWLNTLKKAYKK